MSQNIDFETALAELEKTVLLLEKGELTLEESIKLFEQGMNYTKICNEHLKNAKMVIQSFDETDGE